MHKGFRVNISFHFSWIRTLEWENLGGMVGVHLHFQGAANRLQSGRGLVQPPPRRCARVRPVRLLARASCGQPFPPAVPLWASHRGSSLRFPVCHSYFCSVDVFKSLAHFKKMKLCFLLLGVATSFGGRDTESLSDL